MARPSLPLKTNRSADRARAFIATQNLQTVSGCPDFGPQRCVVYATGATPTVTFTTEQGTALVLPLNTSGVPVSVDVPVIAIAAITNAVVLAHWWIFPTKDDNQVGPFPLNA